MTKQEIASLKRILRSLDKQIFTYTELKSLITSNRLTLEIPKQKSLRKIIDQLVEQNIFAQITLHFGIRIEKRFIWNNPDVLDLAISLKSGTYFTHLTALYLNGIISLSEIVYVNVEQPSRQRGTDLLQQANIDRAFRAEQRQSKSSFLYNGYQVRLLNGMNTAHLGVIDAKSKKGVVYRYTDIERTLIDITVRPSYANGPNSVLQAYKQIGKDLSTAKLIEYIKRLDYVYPYHQAVGFYLSRTGYFSSAELQPFKGMGITYMFYLAHGMMDVEFDEEWKIYYPSGLRVANERA